MSLVVSDLKIDKSSYKPGETVQIYYKVANIGDRHVMAKFIYTVDGFVVKEGYRLIYAGDTVEIIDYVNAPQQGGSHQLCVDAEVYAVY